MLEEIVNNLASTEAWGALGGCFTGLLIPLIAAWLLSKIDPYIRECCRNHEKEKP